MTAVDRPDNGQELDAVVQTIAAMYRDPEVARYAMNDLRDWLTGDREAPSTAVRAALRAANLPLTSGRAGAGGQQREQVARWLADHYGEPPVRALDPWRADAAALLELLALLGGPQPDEQPEPCPVYSHGDSGWHCAVTGDHDQHTNAAGDVTW